MRSSICAVLVLSAAACQSSPQMGADPLALSDASTAHTAIDTPRTMARVSCPESSLQIVIDDVERTPPRFEVIAFFDESERVHTIFLEGVITNRDQPWATITLTVRDVDAPDTTSLDEGRAAVLYQGIGDLDLGNNDAAPGAATTSVVEGDLALLRAGTHEGADVCGTFDLTLTSRQDDASHSVQASGAFKGALDRNPILMPQGSQPSDSGQRPDTR